MKTAIEFLREKNILAEGFTKFEVKFSEGFAVDFVELFEEYANQSKWISVEDRLPNVGETVLCISEEGRISTEQYCKGQTGIYCEQTDSGFATHWQYLPEKP